VNGFDADGQVPIKKLAMNPNKRVSIASKASSINASRPVVKQLASKAFTSYVRSVTLMPNKEIFDARSIPLGTPRLTGGDRLRSPRRWQRSSPRRLG
jgi:hypothetical protein